VTEQHNPVLHRGETADAADTNGSAASLTLEHTTRLEEYRSLRAEYAQNSSILNGAFQVFYVGVGAFLTLLDGKNDVLRPSVCVVVAFCFNTFGWTQLHYLRTNLSIIGYIVETLLPRLQVITAPGGSKSSNNVPAILGWEACYISQVSSDISITNRALAGVIIIARYGMPYIAALLVTGLGVFREWKSPHPDISTVTMLISFESIACVCIVAAASVFASVMRQLRSNPAVQEYCKTHLCPR
jgi:hypothetical protein